jgi:hypothetical protein
MATYCNVQPSAAIFRPCRVIGHACRSFLAACPFKRTQNCPETAHPGPASGLLIKTRRSPSGPPTVALRLSPTLSYCPPPAPSIPQPGRLQSAPRNCQLPHGSFLEASGKVPVRGGQGRGGRVVGRGDWRLCVLSAHLLLGHPRTHRLHPSGLLRHLLTASHACQIQSGTLRKLP